LIRILSRKLLQLALYQNTSSVPKQKLGIEMTKTVKRREWTKDDVRELKSLASAKEAGGKNREVA
jgi:hypothetical protein